MTRIQIKAMRESKTKAQVFQWVTDVSNKQNNHQLHYFAKYRIRCRNIYNVYNEYRRQSL